MEYNKLRTMYVNKLKIKLEKLRNKYRSKYLILQDDILIRLCLLNFIN
jgi:hypothetical protein